MLKQHAKSFQTKRSRTLWGGNRKWRRIEAERKTRRSRCKKVIKQGNENKDREKRHM
jgi:hypothetical protein